MTIDKNQENVKPGRRDDARQSDRRANGHDLEASAGDKFLATLKDDEQQRMPADSGPPFRLGKVELGKPDQIPVREFLYGDHYIRRYVSMTAAPGGTGKTAVAVAEALAMVTTQPLLGIRAKRPRRVWYIGEDDIIELQRRFAAAARRYAIQPYLLDWLFINSFRDTPMVICDGGEDEQSPAWMRRQRLIHFLIANHIDVLMADPFHKTHLANENDNAAMNQVMAAWIEVAEKANCAIELLLHTRKPIPGGIRGTDDVRGASSQVDAARHVRALVKMSETEAAEADIEEDERFRYIRFADPKANMSIPEIMKWYRLDSVTLGNGDGALIPHDSVQVASLFQPKSLFEDISDSEIRAIMKEIATGVFREHYLANNWAGNMIINKLGWQDTEVNRRKIKRVISAWIKSGWLKIDERKDGKSNPRNYLIIGAYEFTN